MPTRHDTVDKNPDLEPRKIGHCDHRTVNYFTTQFFNEHDSFRAYTFRNGENRERAMRVVQSRRHGAGVPSVDNRKNGGRMNGERQNYQGEHSKNDARKEKITS